MSDVKEPVDLVAIRARMIVKSPWSPSDFAKMLEDQDRLREVDAPDMADEIEALRAMLKRAAYVIEEYAVIGTDPIVGEIRAILPPS